jgi:hypothetical protein
VTLTILGETKMTLKTERMVVWESMSNVLVASGSVKVVTKMTAARGTDRLLTHEPPAVVARFLWAEMIYNILLNL